MSSYGKGNDAPAYRAGHSVTISGLEIFNRSPLTVYETGFVTVTLNLRANSIFIWRVSYPVTKDCSKDYRKGDAMKEKAIIYGKAG